MHKPLILGETGAGKTASLRNLDPVTTAIINSDKKSLPLENWRRHYVNVKGPTGKTDLTKSNYAEIDQPNQVLHAMKTWDDDERIKTIVLDTATHSFTKYYMSSTIGKDFSAYQNLGLGAYDLFDFVRGAKKNIVIFAHTDVKFNDQGMLVVQMKSYGNMIENMVPPSFFTTVLMAEVKRVDGVNNHIFRTKTNGPDPAKSPVRFNEDGTVSEALPEEMPNDVLAVLKALDEFEGIITI